MTAEDRVRCSDAEREEAVRALQNAAAQGRLTLAETDERTAAVYSARYRDQLRGALAELPAPESRRERAPAGWMPVLVMSGWQLLSDLALLAGSAGVPANRRRRVVLAALTAAGLLFVVLLAVHGIAGEGHELERH
ncbi:MULTISPECIES: DUF1707 domain-containing protein [Amycolatopsis]|uniref:DUF1707 SHOCT-like domain-containing protein n=1 Tax=Amycolatopsis TaxID=1813 RepID=UPI0007E0BBA1|nr:DUF1707 domain-containing protein [Amycolatopsis sp. M39]OAP26097.1 hypothetical protein A4R44_03475 [Amycolatopsis sp. M39]